MECVVCTQCCVVYIRFTLQLFVLDRILDWLSTRIVKKFYNLQQVWNWWHVNNDISEL